MSGKKIKVGIAEDQTMFRHGLLQLLNGLKGIEVVIEAENGQDFMDKIPNSGVEIALLDYKMPVLNGPQTARLITELYKEVKILFLSMYEDEEFIIQAMDNGANGYITKDEDIDEIEKAIHSIKSTGYYMNDNTSRLLVANLLNQGKMKPEFLHTMLNQIGDCPLSLCERPCRLPWPELYGSLRLFYRDLPKRFQLLHRAVR